MTIEFRRWKLVAIALVLAQGCASSGVQNTAGSATVYEDASSGGKVQGIGVESRDIVAMTDKMMRDMLANRILAAANPSPRVIVDSEYFTNESSSRLNKNQITDRLRVELNRAGNGRMVFVGRQYADMVAKERDLKESGVVDQGTVRQTKAQAGADYRLAGRISSQDTARADGMSARYTQIVFEMVDVSYGTIVWSGLYEFKKVAQDDVIYR